MRLSPSLVDDLEVADALEKAMKLERLSFKDGLALMRCKNLHLLGSVADQVRKRLVGDAVTFVQSYNLNYTNYCVARCSICAFYRPYKKGQSYQGGYTLSLEDVLREVAQAVEMGATEIHIVGGFNPELPIEYYEGLLKGIKARWPRLTLKALTLAEVHFIATISRCSIEEVLLRLKEAGLDCNTGGGAEIFDPEVRAIISTAPKCSGEEWLRVAEIAHRLGIPGNSTMLYGHVEEPKHIVDHILKLREVQDRAPGFLSFIPLKYSPDNTELYLSGRVKGPASSHLDLRVIATARLLLAKSINNISVYWVGLGTDLAQVALTYGGNDLVGTAFREKVYGATGRREQVTLEKLAHLVREVNRVPIERDTFYNSLRVL